MDMPQGNLLSKDEECAAARCGITVSEIACAVGGTVSGCGDTVITSASSVADAAQGDIVLAENEKYLVSVEKTSASAVIAAIGSACSKPMILVSDPKVAFVQVLRMLAPKESQPEPGIDPGCRVGEGLSLGEGAAIGFGSYIGSDVTIGDGAIIHPLVYIGDGVKIGAGTVIRPNVTIYHGCEIGSNVVIHSGTVIGADGFGYIPAGGKLCKVPQIGNVVIEDDVEIGTNVSIDRAKTGSTRIGRGTKIDNLVQIAHNIKTGQTCLIVAQAGLSGSIELGNGVTIAGQAGLKDHIRIGDGAVVAARAGIFGDVPAGSVYSGYPARPHRESLRASAALTRLPETLKVVESLQKEVELLKERLAQLGGE